MTLVPSLAPSLSPSLVPALARGVLLGTLVLALTGCGVTRSIGTRLGFAPAEPDVTLPYRARLTAGENGAFSVRVRARGAGLDRVRESARFPATAHCLLTFGGSEVDWALGPDGDWLVRRDAAGDLVVGGTCSDR